jgi:hypothetical protein
MVPPRLASEAFRLFLEIPKSRIESDIEEGPDGYEPARQRVARFLRTPEEQMTAELCAEYMHAEMIQACAAQKHPGVHDDVAFHLAGTAARDVARAALFAAETTGELGRLNAEMGKIRDASGVEGFDELEEQPPEYVELAEKAGGLLQRIETMMVIDVLKRYGLRDHAELFERDEAAFDARVREGYYVLFPEKRKP